MRCRIYTDVSLIPEGKLPVIMLYPFTGLPEVSADDPDAGRFIDYMNKGKELFELTSIEEADLFVLPFDFSFEKEITPVITQFVDVAKRHNKRVVIFYNSDDDTPIVMDNVIVYRTSLYRTTAEPYEYAFPGWSVDFLKAYFSGELRYRAFSQTPVVGYCGYVDFIEPTWRDLLKNFLNVSGIKSWEKLRGAAVRRIRRSERVIANLIIRNGFWASGVDDKKKARKEYVENLIQSDYAIVCRGGGNFSYRLYEVMSLGRIPVFIDTDCVLPFRENIPWKELMVWVDKNEVNVVDKIVQEFHCKQDEDQFLQLQKNIRGYYENFISPLGFFTRLSEQFGKRR